MRLLLDTHVLLWVLNDDKRLGSHARTLLSSRVEAYVSPVSGWELAIKSLLGKLAYPGGTSDRSAHAGLQELPVTLAHAEAVLSLPLELQRRDPFDRLLLAQAHAENMSLLTADRLLVALDLPWIINAR